MTIELEGKLKAITFKAKGKTEDVVGIVAIECFPNEGESGKLSRLAGKDVEVTIVSRQIGLPLRDDA